MELSAEFVDGEFRRAISQYRQATRKELPEILNRAGKNVAFRAVQFTPKASLGQINRHNPGRKTYLGRLHYAQSRVKKGQGIRQDAERRHQRRRRSKGYVAAGWLKAARAFGGNPRSAQLIPGGRASRGGGIKATPFRLYADLFNASEGAQVVGVQPLNRALLFVARDMEQFAQRRLATIANRHSAR